MFSPPVFQRWKIPAVIFLSVVLVLAAARHRLYFRTPLLEQGDAAANALQIHAAKHFVELYGNYSRFEFNHPGPAFFYVYAAAEWVLYDKLHGVPSPANAHLLAGACLQGFFFTAALTLLARLMPWRAFLPLGLLTGAIDFGLLRDAFVSIWPPHVLVMPFLCFLAACTSVALGRWRNLPLMVLAGGFLFHGHVAQPLFAGLLGTLALGLGVRRWRAGASPGRTLVAEHRWAFAASGLLTAIFLLPLILDVILHGARGNVATIFGRLAANAGNHAGALQSLLYFLTYPVATREQNLLFDTLGPPVWSFIITHGGRMAVWLAVLAAPGLLVLARRDRFTTEEKQVFGTAAAMLAMAAAGCMIWGMAQAGGMRHYNGYFYHAIYFFALLLGVGLVARCFEPWWQPGLTAACSLLALAAGLYLFRSRPVPPAELGLSIQRGVAAVLAGDPDSRPKLLIFAYEDWPTAAAVSVELTRRNVRFYVLPWWSFMFQRRHDARQVEAEPGRGTEPWWIASRETGGEPVTRNLAIHRAPASLDPAGGEISFQEGGNGFRYVLSGMMRGETGPPATNERRVLFRFVPRATASDVRLTFDAQADTTAAERVTAEVFLNGVRCGEAVAASRGETSVMIPAVLWNQAVDATLELRFPSARPRRSPTRPGYESWASWQLWKIRCESPTAHSGGGPP